MVMRRENLIKIVTEFNKTKGAQGKLIKGVDNAMIFANPTGALHTDEHIVYFHQKGEEKAIVTNLKQIVNKYSRVHGGDKTGRRFFLTNEPIPVSDLPIIKKYEFTYQTPVQFFDREFSFDKSSPLKAIEEKARRFAKERIQQPYDKREHEKYKQLNYKKDEDAIITEDDLLDELLLETRQSTKACLRIIIAPAGYGKTVLMNSLYIRLLDDFLSLKKSQKMGMRPLMMLPGHIKRSDNIENLVNNFISAEYDYGVATDKTFEFWINNGFAIWLLDGLEELILRIPDTSEFIYQLLDKHICANNTIKPQIIISIRKPILATKPELNEVINEWKKENDIMTYELVDWGIKQQEAYINRNMSLPELERNSFIDEIKSNQTLGDLCKVPFYTSLITSLKSNEELKVFNDEVELVMHSAEKICEREFEKGLDIEIFPVKEQTKMFSEIAVDGFEEDNVFLSKSDFSEWITIPLSEYSDDIIQEQLECFNRHAVLGQFGENVCFDHDIIRDFYLANGLLNEFLKANIKPFDKGEIEVDNLVYKFLLKNSNSINWNLVFEKLWETESTVQSKARAFRNILKIYLNSNDDNKEERIKALLNNRNLDGIIFSGLNLRGFNFEGSNLSSVKFLNCNLEKANFNRCHFRDTFISEDCKLEGVSKRDAILDSISTEKRNINQQKEIQKYFYSKTDVSETLVPCQATVNLLRVIEKLLRKRRGQYTIRKYISVPGYAVKIISALDRRGYLTNSGDSVRIKISLYDELVTFYKELKVTPRINEVLNDICSDIRTGCKHV